ncbi:MAG: NADH-ubiquinone oxidoreductase-F iron-sulfur binding region domain-containing protein [Pseudomonadota bacterium]
MSQLNQVLFHENSRVGADLTAWKSTIGGQGLSKALENTSAIIPTIQEAGLSGLGGSGFPTYRKWQFVADQNNDQDKYLICNGNEDEPGTFKDRILLQEAPHQVIEGACITALACGINRIVFYINPDQKESLAVVEQAVQQWRDSEFFNRVETALGKELELTVRPSSGHYIGGEETAAIESVEGNFPFPRGKPPFPAVSGVFGKPTLINNMETLSNVSHILRKGAEWYGDLGLGDSRGTKIYCLSGDVLYPGAYELPMGTQLATLINEYGGGMLLEKKLKAVFTGGPSNTILTPKDLDVSLDFDSVKQRDSALGTGAMIVISEGTGIVKRVAEYVNFFAHSSCGQCPSCKNGTFYAAQLLTRIDTGKGSRADLDALMNLYNMLPGSGRCHMLDGAMKVLQSSMQHFMHEYEQAVSRS